MGGENLGDNNKVVKFKKRRSINIGVIVFLILFVYIAINVYLYFTKEKLSIYEVHEGTTAIDNQITGIILREEKVMKSDKAGYITYFQKEGARVAKGTSVYSVDDNGMMVEAISNGEIAMKLTEKDNAELRHEIRAFQSSFSNTEYSSVYEFKENVKGTVLDILNSSIINQTQELMEETGINYSFDMVPSPESGIITYYMDSFEAITPEGVTMDMFQLENYERLSLRTPEMVTASSPIYKLITSETWSIVLPLTTEQYELLLEKETVKATIIEDNLELTAKISLFQKGSDSFAKLTLNQYLSNYLEERFIDVRLDFDTVEGLKIPLTSIVEKDFYLVPLEYFTLGGESTKEGLIKEVYDETGEVTFPFVEAQKYYEDENYGYVDADLFTPGTWITSPDPDSDDRYQLNQTSKLTGVYNVNQGYAVFNRIEILYQNKEYCIIDDNTPKGVSAYDQIALDATTAIEEKIIY